jgi:hypothetical protein
MKQVFLAACQSWRSGSGGTESSVYGPVHHWGRAPCQALKMVKDSSHPSHRLLSLLPRGKQYRITKSETKRLMKSFYPQAMRLLNSSSNGYPDYLHSPPDFYTDCLSLTLSTLLLYSHTLTYYIYIPTHTCILTPHTCSHRQTFTYPVATLFINLSWLPSHFKPNPHVDNT